MDRAAVARKSLNRQGGIWAAIVDAYLADNEPIELLSHLMGDTLVHQQLRYNLGDIKRSQVFALADDGLLDVMPTGSDQWDVTVPIRILRALAGQAPSIYETEGEERVQVIMATNFYKNQFLGGSHNIAQGSTNVTQTISIVVLPGDLDGLLSALRQDGLTEEGVGEVLDAIESDGGRQGPNVARVLGEILIGASGELLAAGVVGSQVAPKVLGHLQQFFA